MEGHCPFVRQKGASETDRVRRHLWAGRRTGAHRTRVTQIYQSWLPPALGPWPRLQAYSQQAKATGMRRLEQGRRWSGTWVPGGGRGAPLTPDDDATESRLGDCGCQMLDGSQDGVRCWMVIEELEGPCMDIGMDAIFSCQSILTLGILIMI